MTNTTVMRVVVFEDVDVTEVTVATYNDETLEESGGVSYIIQNPRGESEAEKYKEEFRDKLAKLVFWQLGW